LQLFGKAQAQVHNQVWLHQALAIFDEYEITLRAPPKVCIGVLDGGTPFGK